MPLLDGFEVPEDGRTTYGFRPGHVFGIWNPDEVLFEVTGCDEDILEVHPVGMPNLVQSIAQDEFRKLVRQGKVDPRVDANSEARRRVAATNASIEYLRDADDDEREALLFYMLLCRRIEEEYEAKTTSKSEAALKRTIPRIMAELVLGIHPEVLEADRASITQGGRRGRKKTAFVAETERRVRARKSKRIFDTPSPSTVKRWIAVLKEYEWDPVAIRDKRKGRSGAGAPRLATLSHSVMAPWVRAYCCRSRPSKALLYRLMVGSVDLDGVNEERDARGQDPVPQADLLTFALANAERQVKGLRALPVPSLSTFERAVDKLAKYDVCVGRWGVNEARRQFRIAGRRTAVIAAGERVAIDCWTVQLMTLKLPSEFWDGIPDDLIDKLGALRLCLCVAICEATRVVLGARLSVKANTETSLRTLSMVCRDKTALAQWAECRRSWHQACTPECVPSDSGNEFIDANVRCAVRDIGSANEIGPGKHPDARAVGERFFGTLDAQSMPFFQGRTFSNVVDKGDYDPKSFANVVAADLGKAFVRYIVDVYHLAPHGGLGGQSPSAAWAEKTARYQVMPPPRPVALRVVFGFADDRRIQNYGIRFLGLWYESEALMELRMDVGQADVWMRADLDNLGAISVRKNKPGSKWFTVPCVTPMEGVGAREMMETTRQIRNAHAQAAELDEPDFLAALAAIRKLGLHSAAAAGLGPSTISREEVLEFEQKHSRHFRIVTATERDQAFGGNDLVVHDADEESPLLDDQLPHADAKKSEGSTRRRRPPTGSSFLKG